MRLIASLAAQGTEVENTTDETVFQGFTIPADYLSEGMTLKLRVGVKVLDNNSTDTLTVRGRLGGATLTGTAWFTSTAVDVVDDDICVIDVEVKVRSIGTAGEVVVCGVASDPDAAGIAAGAHLAVIGSLDTTADLFLEVTGEWSVAHAENEAACEFFNVYEVI